MRTVPTRTVTVEEARADLDALLRAAEGGEEVTITRDGRRVGRLVAPLQARDMNPAEAIEGLRRLRESLPKGGPTVRELVEEIRAERES